MVRFWNNSLYIIVILLLSGCESLFFWPSKKMVPSPEYFNFEKQDLFFTVEDNHLIHAWRLPAKAEKRGTIYFLHGNGQNLSYHVANVFWLAEKGWEIVLIDYRGYGRSVGKPDFSSVQKDALAGYRAILNKRSDNLPIIVWGQSLGASVAINMTTSLSLSEQPQGLIIDSSFSSHRKIMQEVLGKSWLTWPLQYPLSWPITNSYSPDRVMSQLNNVPLLIVHSEHDPLINVGHAKRLYELAPQPKQLWISQQKGHITIWNNEQWRDKLICQLSNWPKLQPADDACSVKEDS